VGLNAKNKITATVALSVPVLRHNFGIADITKNKKN
jgi:hypothetical protein